MPSPYCLWVVITIMTVVSQENHLEAKEVNPLPSSSMEGWFILSHSEQLRLFWCSTKVDLSPVIWWLPLKLLLLTLPLLTHPLWLLCLIKEGLLLLPLDYWVAPFLWYSFKSFSFMWGGESVTLYLQDKSWRLGTGCHPHESGKSSGTYFRVIPWPLESLSPLMYMYKEVGGGMVEWLQVSALMSERFVWLWKSYGPLYASFSIL